MRLARHTARTQEVRNSYKVLVESFEGKLPLVRPRCRWKDIKIDCEEMGLEGVDFIHLATGKDRWPAFVNAVMDLRVP
jgi:hypothetical protein